MATSPLEYKPKFPVATYTDQYGEERVIHAARGPNGRLSRLKGLDTPALLMNRAVATLLGQNIRKRRLELGLTAKEVAVRSGSTETMHKQYIWKLETGFRKEGVRLGTLFALAHALECAPGDLLPDMEEAMELAGVKPTTSTTLAA